MVDGVEDVLWGYSCFESRRSDSGQGGENVYLFDSGFFQSSTDCRYHEAFHVVDLSLQRQTRGRDAGTRTTEWTDPESKK